MIRAAYILCAQVVAIDKLTNGVIVFNIIESVPLPTFPFWLPSIQVVVVLRCDKGDPDALDGNLVIQMDGQELASTDVHAEFQGDLGCNMLFGFQGIRIPGEGEIEVRLRLPNMEDAVYRMRILRLPQHPEAPTGPAAIVSSSDVQAPASS